MQIEPIMTYMAHPISAKLKIPPLKVVDYTLLPLLLE